MKEYGWSWDDYLNAPEWLIESAKCKMQVEAEYQIRENSRRK